MKRTLYLDDGHGMETPGKRTPIMPEGKAKGRIIHENEFNRKVVEKLKDLALRRGYRVVEVAPGDRDVPLRVRSKAANDDFKRHGLQRSECAFVSIHANALDGQFGTNKGGVETYHFPGSKEGHELASKVHVELIKGTEQINRGVKAANFHVLRETLMPAILVEACFMDVLEEALLLLSDSFQSEVALEVMNGLDLYFGISPADHLTPIIGPPSATLSQVKAWARAKGASTTFIGLADIFWSLGLMKGVDPCVAYGQSAKETNFGRFGGVIDESFMNPCGMKVTAGGGNYDARAHQVFASWAQGIEAQMDHLLLYAGAKGYPRANTPDPRHFPSIAGKAKYVEDLSGNWAPGKSYGPSIVENYMKPMQAIVVPEEASVGELKETIHHLEAKHQQAETLLLQALDTLRG